MKRKDVETGLHYNRYRYYEPFSARYISKDPIGLDGGYNKTIYVRNTTTYIDPLGLKEWKGTGYYINVSGVAGVKYDVKSQCLDGERGIASVVALGGGKKLKDFATMGARGVDVTFIDPYSSVNLDALKGKWTNKSKHVVLTRGIGNEKAKLGEAVLDGGFTTYNRGAAIAPLGVKREGIVIERLSTFRKESCSINEVPICSGPNGRCKPVPPKPKPIVKPIDPKDIPKYDITDSYKYPPNVNLNTVLQGLK